MSNAPLTPVFIPALVAVLLNAERLKGSPLTREEVLGIRDRSACVMLPSSEARAMAAARGYDDVHPEFVWDDWQAVRDSLAEDQDPV